MKIILLEDVKPLGKRGEVKSVADGYARNFLLPRNLVKPATAEAIKDLDLEKAKLEEQLEKIRSEMQDIEKATAAEPLVFQVKVGERGEIFGSLGNREVQEKLLERFPKLQKADLEVKADHIKELGKQEVKIKAGRGEGKVTIEVQPQQP